MDTLKERAEGRSRADRRLRRMTIGTTLAAVTATVGFGSLAALTHAGTSTTTASAIDPADTAAGDPTNPFTAAADDMATSAGGPAAAATPAPVVTRTSRRAHVTTGGS